MQITLRVCKIVHVKFEILLCGSNLGQLNVLLKDVIWNMYVNLIVLSCIWNCSLWTTLKVECKFVHVGYWGVSILVKCWVIDGVSIEIFILLVLFIQLIWFNERIWYISATRFWIKNCWVVIMEVAMTTLIVIAM